MRNMRYNELLTLLFLSTRNWNRTKCALIDKNFSLRQIKDFLRRNDTILRQNTRTETWLCFFIFLSVCNFCFSQQFIGGFYPIKTSMYVNFKSDGFHFIKCMLWPISARVVFAHHIPYTCTQPKYNYDGLLEIHG